MTKEKLEETIESYGKSIYSFCLKLTGSRDIADDLYQDTWLFEITNIFNSTEELEALAGIKLWSSDSISVMHNDFS